MQESNNDGNVGNQDEIDSSSIVHLGFVLDIKNNKNKWVREQLTDLIKYTIQMINDHSDGWHDDDIFPDGTVIEGLVQDADCDAFSPPKAYSTIRRQLNNTPPMGLIGARCSDSSNSLAMVSGLDNVPQVSHASSSPALSDSSDYPLFSRLVAPDNAMGQVGALVSMLKSLGYSRVSIIKTDNQYSRDLALSFRRLWMEHQGEIAYESVVQLNADDDLVNEASVNEVLRSYPKPDSMMTLPGSRVILLIAQEQHAYDILRLAHGIGFQKDTVWFGSDAWIGRSPEDFAEPSFLSGYLGITPYRNRDYVYQNYLQRLNTLLSAAGKPTFEDLPDYAAETLVDSILALTMALSEIPVSLRRNGTLVTEIIRNLSFRGVSGEVAFTAEGDRANPAYSVYNAQTNATSGKLEWVNVGTVLVNSTNGSTTNEIRQSDMCFPQMPCGVTTVPSDSYPVLPVPLWIVIVNPLIVVALGAVLYRYCRSRRKIEELQEDRDRRLREFYERPAHWTESEYILVEVIPSEGEYSSVTAQLRRDMPDAHITRLWRVQNHPLWAYYSFHKDRLTWSDIEHNETWVWHGTSDLDPAVIYNDRLDGFMMQYARMGRWGRGIYFAEKSRYSHDYAYKPYGEDGLATFNDRPMGQEDEQEMLLTQLIVGRATHFNDPCRDLTVPPEDPDNPGQKFNTVTGETGGSTVYVVYENGRAYPAYLVRYYRGERQPEHTTLETQDEAQQYDDSSKQPHLSSLEENGVHGTISEIATTTTSTTDEDLESGLSSTSSSCEADPDCNATGNSQVDLLEVTCGVPLDQNIQHHEEAIPYISYAVPRPPSLFTDVRLQPAAEASRDNSDKSYLNQEPSGGEEEDEDESSTSANLPGVFQHVARAPRPRSISVNSHDYNQEPMFGEVEQDEDARSLLSDQSVQEANQEVAEPTNLSQNELTASRGCKMKET